MKKTLLTNPTKSCVLPRLEKKEMKILPLDNLNTFFEEAKNSGVFELYYRRFYAERIRPHDAEDAPAVR